MPRSTTCCPISTPSNPLHAWYSNESLGADGIVANKDIQSMADLRGKAVGFAERTVSQFFLNLLLKRAGLSQADIEHIEMSADDAGNAFLMQEVDAAVTWEPWLSQGNNPSTGICSRTRWKHRVCSSTAWSRRPPSSTTVWRSSDARRALGCGSGLRRVPSRRGHRIMARHVGGWLEDPAVFAETLKGVRFYDAEKNRRVLRHPGRPRADLPGRAVRHRRLVKPWHARYRADAGRRDPERPGQVGGSVQDQP